MKRWISLIAVGLFLAVGFSGCVGENILGSVTYSMPASASVLNPVTLYSYLLYQEYTKATFNFLMGTGDDVNATYNDWDILYEGGQSETAGTDDVITDVLDILLGNSTNMTEVNGGKMMVRMHGGDTDCYIADIGTGNLNDFTKVSQITSSANWEETTNATKNHVYVVHTNQDSYGCKAEYYSKFKIVEMVAYDSITIEWQCAYDGENFVYGASAKPLADETFPILLAWAGETNNQCESIFNFVSGVRADFNPHNHDMEYGNGGHLIDTQLHGGQKSLIKDMGLIDYNSLKETPIKIGNCSLVLPLLEHTYVVRIDDGGAVFHVKFKIVAEQPGRWIQFKWAKIGGQSEPDKLGPAVVDNGANPVILYSRWKYDNYTLATFNFWFGTRDDVDKTRNNWDLEYGNGEDNLGVRMVTNDRSYIADLGLGELNDFTKVSEIPKDVNWQENTKAVNGHVYVVHTVEVDENEKTETEYYSKFKITDMASDDWMKMEWQCAKDGQNFE
jgi:hypothetical protein